MSRKFLLAATIGLLLVQSEASSQSQGPPKFEVAAEFTTLTREDFTGQRTEPGLGGRFTYNLNKNLGVEAAGYFFPHRCFSCVNNGRMTEAVAGMKAGKRFQSWGIFAKARPGVVSFSRSEINVIQTGAGPFPFVFELDRLTNFAIDFGAVVEFYPSRHIVTRFDAGDTLVHFKQRTNNDIRFDALTGNFTIVPITTPAKTNHNFQFIASVGFRF